MVGHIVLAYTETFGDIHSLCKIAHSMCFFKCKARWSLRAKARSQSLHAYGRIPVCFLMCLPSSSDWRTSSRTPPSCTCTASPRCGCAGAPSCGLPCGTSCHTSCTGNCALLELSGSSFAFSWCCPAGWRRGSRARWRGPSQPWDCLRTVQEEDPVGSMVPQGAPGVGSTGTGHNRGTALHAPSFHVSRSLNSRRRAGSKGWVVQATLGEVGKTGSWTAPLASRGPWKGSCCLGLGSCCL